MLATIHTSHPYVPIRPNIIAQLHRDLLKFSPESRWKWKPGRQEIADFRADGSAHDAIQVRVGCAHARVDGATLRWLQPTAGPGSGRSLLLIPAFVLDFLCIHPFLDGNGRMARLLSLLLLYQAGYKVGRYISLKQVVEVEGMVL